VENLADFISAYIIGNLLQMGFRFWAFRRWVFPDQFARKPDKALESALTAGGIAEGSSRTRTRAAWKTATSPCCAPGAPGQSVSAWRSSEPRCRNFVIQQRVHLAQARNVVRTPADLVTPTR